MALIQRQCVADSGADDIGASLNSIQPAARFT